ncbi:MAG: aldo/keto reductase, partial [Microbacterium sp.]
MNDSRPHRSSIPEVHRPYTADEGRYGRFEYRQVGASGLFLPPISLGLWWNFGDNIPMDNQRALLRHAFDSGITHFDLANNYGPPYGSAEKNFGRILAEDLRPYRDELIISSKAGWDMWPGPYGDFASRKYLLASAEQSLTRMGLDYVDIFYSHRVDPVTPIEETVGALDTLVRQGKALYVGISSYSAARTEAAVAVARELGTPLVIHQPSYSILNRWIEDGLTDTLRQTGLGAIAFTPLAQGLLTGKYLADGTAERAQQRGSLSERPLPDETLAVLRGLNDIAAARGQSLAQLAVQWT